jgi:cation diffusion facilitator family transporter
MARSTFFAGCTIADLSSPAEPSARSVRASSVANAGAVHAAAGGPSTSRRSVIVGLGVAIAQTVALGIAANSTGSVAMRTQTVTNLADVAVGGFLLVGVLRSDQPPDSDHPLGYGRERFFWSFVAAVGIFVGGVGAAAAETIQALLHPQPTGFYGVGYLVLGVVICLDVAALIASLRPLRRRARSRHVSLVRLLWRGTDPAVTTVFLSSAAGLTGGVIAVTGLAAREITHRPIADAIASAMIGLVLLATSALLLRTTRELLTGRGVSPVMIERMRTVVANQAGIIGVPDIFAIVVGPASLIVAGDVIFDDALDVPRVESAIVDAAAELRRSWPMIVYVYLNPVAVHRTRGRSPDRENTRPGS